MKKFFVNCLVGVSLVLFVFSIAKAQNSDSFDFVAARRNLMPVPASVTWKSGRLPLTKTFSAAIKGQTDERLKLYLDRALKRLENRTVLEISHQLSHEDSAALVVECQALGETIPAVNENESYNLEISDKQARLTAATTIGAMRGLETFLQLIEADETGFFLPAVSISDKPRFPWRGLMIDVARHYQPLEVLKRNLDAMAAVKLNVLHWHLTDDQGFRVENKSFPKLYQLGSDNLFYTQTEIREIIKYAADRGIRVVPEFDMPGHATAWVVGHPELASAPGPYKIERGAGVFDPTLDPTREEVYAFLDQFLGEMANLFPDAYLHIGGDENEGKQWDANPKIQAFMREKNFKDHHALQNYFTQRLLKILQKHRKIMMGWDEIFEPNLPKDVVVHSWRGQKALSEAARQGNQVVLSNGYYIDLMFPAAQHYAVDPLPADTVLTAEEQKRVLGGEATMWAEWVSPETIDSRIWSRTAAIAERFWSAREVNQVPDMYRRLAVIDRQLEELGLTHRKNQAMLLRRLTNNQDIAALQTLVSLIEPVKEYKRYQVRPQTMLSPLTGLVDAAQADAQAAREFAVLLDAALSDASTFQKNAAEIQKILIEWQNAGKSLAPMIERSPGLQEAKPLVNDLSELGAIGLEAVSFLSKRAAPTAQWRADQIAKLEQIAKPKAALEFAVVKSVRKLVDAAFESPNLKSTSQKLSPTNNSSK